MKQLCTIHHFYHTEGTECPFCKRDRVASMAKKYSRPKEEFDRPAMLSDIGRLAEKFKVNF